MASPNRIMPTPIPTLRWTPRLKTSISAGPIV